jgi:hypothetical protein
MMRFLQRCVVFQFVFVGIALPEPVSHAAMDHIVFGMKTEVAMAANEVPRKDYYLNIGTNQGVKPGTVLDVFRTVTTTDDINNKSSQNIMFRVAKIKVIHAEGEIAVGRIAEILPPNDVPIGAFPTVVIGDRVAVATK